MRFPKLTIGRALPLLVLFAAMATAWSCRVPLLLERASRTPIPKDQIKTEAYFWKPDGNLVLVSEGWKVFEFNAQTWEPKSLDILTSVFNPEGLTITFSAEQIGKLWEVRTRSVDVRIPCGLSPDGEWMMWEEHGCVCVANPSTLVGSKALWNSESVGKGATVWMPDSRHLVDWYKDGLGLSHAGVTDLISSKSTDILINKSIGDTLVGFTGKSIAVTATIPSVPTRLIEFRNVDLNRPRSTPGRYVVHLPCESVVMVPVLSPRGDRLAWLLDHERFDWVSRLIKVFSPGKATERRLVASLWVSKLDGSSMHEVGSLSHASAGETPLAIKWLPDGKRLSFIYDSALWTVPAD